jgi:lysophospholipase L1-like esterase
MNAREKKWLRRLGRGLAVILLVLCLVLLWFGVASPLTTLTFYGWATWALLRSFPFLLRLRPGSPRIANLRLVILSAMISLLAGELSLRFIFRPHLSYQEQNGSFFYFSPYRQVVLENLLRGPFLGQETGHLRVHEANSRRRYHKPEFNYEHRYNELGLRDRSFAGPRDPNRFRVLAFGDSFTEGVGTPQDSTWPRLLEQQLTTSHPELQPEVLNLACSGSDLVFEWRKWQEWGPDLQPDLVIVALNRSDLQDLIIRGGKDRFGEGGKLHYQPAPLWEYIYSWSYIARSLLHGPGGRNHLLKTSLRMTWGRDTAKDIIWNLLQEWQEDCEQRGIEMLTIVHPTRDEFRKDWMELLFQQKEVVGVANLLPEMKNTGLPIDALFWETDGHFRPEGYTLFAKLVAEELQSRALLPVDSLQ